MKFLDTARPIAVVAVCSAPTGLRSSLARAGLGRLGLAAATRVVSKTAPAATRANPVQNPLRSYITPPVVRV